MSHYLENVNLPSDPFDIRLIFDFIFLENLNCHFLACEYMRPESYLSESALTQGPPYKLSRTWSLPTI